MDIIEMIFLGIGLASDASAVSMANGLTDVTMTKAKALLIACFFGLFQAIMPLLGFFIANSFLYNIISKFAPWIALVLLSFLGIKMIIEGKKKQKEDNIALNKKLSMKVLLLQSVATSIDALTVGLLFVAYGTYIALEASIIIGVVTLVLSFISVFIGRKFGTWLTDKAEVFGGIILIIIGLIIFFKDMI